MSIPFSKYEGCGNDFICVDHRKKYLPQEFYQHIPKICSRHTGLGADGVILLESSLLHDYKMRIFNADGSEAEMCGNGIRCLAKFIHSLGDQRLSFCIETMERSLHIHLASHDIKNTSIAVEMGAPCHFQWSVPLTIAGVTHTVHSINTGVPHAVLFDRLEALDFHQLGSAIRHHAHFAPKGTNVNIAFLLDDIIYIRTFERGVENETKACGTGATAVAIIAAEIYQLTPPITIQTSSKQFLYVNFTRKTKDVIDDVVLSGPANFMNSGYYSLV